MTYFANPFARNQRRGRVRVHYEPRDALYYAAIEDTRQGVWRIYYFGPSDPEGYSGLHLTTPTILRQDFPGRYVAPADVPPRVRAVIDARARSHR